jgi:hypothetical protein
MSERNTRAPRIPLRLSAELRIGGRLVTGTTRNLSDGGVCVELDLPLAEGSTVNLTLFVVEEEIEAEGARGLDLTATVRWTAEGERGYSAGLQFEGLSAIQKAGVERALKAVGET